MLTHTQQSLPVDVCTGELFVDFSNDGHEVKAELQHDERGVYLLKYRLTSSQSHGTIRVSVRLVRHGPAEHIQGSPFDVPLRPCPAHAPNCTAQGGGLHSTVSGDQAFFVVTMFDEYNIPLRRGGDVVGFAISDVHGRVLLSSPHTRSSDGDGALDLSYIEDNGDGTYSVSYIHQPWFCGATGSGIHSVAVHVNGSPVLDSPFALDVLYAFAPASFCEGLEGRAFTAGVPIVFDLSPHTKSSTPIALIDYTKEIAVNVSPASELGAPVHICNASSGDAKTYRVSFTANKAGEYLASSYLGNLYGSCPKELWPYIVMALYSYGPI